MAIAPRAARHYVRAMTTFETQENAGPDWARIIGYAPAVRRGPLVMVAGTGPLGADGRPVHAGDAAAQTRRCLERVEERLAAVGARLDQVVQTRILLSPGADWEAVGRVHGELLGAVEPVTTMVRVELLDPEFLVEIEAVAWGEEEGS